MHKSFEGTYFFPSVSRQFNFFIFPLLDSILNVYSHDGMGLPGFNQYYARINLSCSMTQHSDTGEA